jgi:hypothetical protein
VWQNPLSTTRVFVAEFISRDREGVHGALLDTLEALTQVALGLVLNVSRRDFALPGMIEIGKDFGKNSVSTLLRFFQIAGLERLLNCLGAEYLSQVFRDLDSNVPAIAAPALATTAL